MTPRSVPPRPEMLASLNIVLEALEKSERENQISSGRMPSNAPNIEDGPSVQTPLLDNEHPPVDYNSTPSGRTGWDNIVLAGHSYGTFVSGWVIRQVIDVDSFNDPSLTSPEKELTNKIAHTILIDPIPILPSNPTVAYNFLYRHPSSVCPRKLGSVYIPEVVAEVTDTLLDVELGPSSASVAKSLSSRPSYYSSAAAWQLWYFASRDADVARTLFRTFFWTEGGIWKEDIVTFLLGGRARCSVDDSEGGTLATSASSNWVQRRRKGRNMAVVLGGMDQVVPAEAVRRYLTKEEKWKESWVGAVVDDADAVNGMDTAASLVPSGSGDQGRHGRLDVIFNPKLDHAVIFDEDKWTMPLVDVVRRYVRDV